jgi:hypothetical protein
MLYYVWAQDIEPLQLYIYTLNPSCQAGLDKLRKRAEYLKIYSALISNYNLPEQAIFPLHFHFVLNNFFSTVFSDT